LINFLRKDIPPPPPVFLHEGLRNVVALCDPGPIKAQKWLFGRGGGSSKVLLRGGPKKTKAAKNSFSEVVRGSNQGRPVAVSPGRSVPITQKFFVFGGLLPENLIVFSEKTFNAETHFVKSGYVPGATATPRVQKPPAFSESAGRKNY